MSDKPRILFYRTGGRVSCKLNLGENRRGITYHRGKGNCFRWNRGKDYKEYPLIVSVSYIDDFLAVNDINESEIDPRSLDKFYGFDNHYFPSLSPANVERWWNYDCPDLYRYEVNKDGHVNWFGFRPIYFSSKLFGWDWGNAYVGEDITREEVEKLTKGHESSHITEEMWRVLNAQTLSDGEIEYLAQQVKAYEDNIQAVIDAHKDEILSSVEGMQDGAYGLDCGFLYIYTTNPQYNEQKGLLKNVRHKDISHAPWMNVRMPWEPQSLTIKRKEFEKVKEVVYRELGETLYCKTVLD